MKFGYFSALLFCTALLLSGCGSRDPCKNTKAYLDQTDEIARWICE